MRGWLIAAILTLGACAGEGTTVQPDRAEIGPADFALASCGVPSAEDICVLLSAGGKRLLINTPAGIGDGLGGDELARLDAILLTGLSARQTEGLDEVRNRGWTAGRLGPLQVSGPAGLDLLARGLNGGFQTADAVAQVEANPPGGFGAALIVAREGEGRAPWTAFDTGDLTAIAVPAGRFQQVYLVSYGGKTLLIRPCGVELAGAASADLELTCPDGMAEGDVSWPLSEPIVFLTR